jgi:hypothetical protein
VFVQEREAEVKARLASEIEDSKKLILKFDELHAEYDKLIRFN